MNRRVFLSIAGTVPLLVRGHANAAGLKAVASFSILADVLGNVGGDDVTVVSIVPAGGDAHTFDPDPSIVGELTDANVIVSVGPEFEPWMVGLMASSGANAPQIELLHAIGLEGDHADGDADAATPVASAADPSHEGHDHGDIDPHFWGNVQNMIAAVHVMTDTLRGLEGDNAAALADRSDAYIQQLSDLDAWIHQQIETIPPDQRKLVTNHDTFGYYATAYGLEILGTALGSVTTEGGDPSARDIANLVRQIEDTHVRAIFAENVANPDLMQSIADEAGVTLAPPLYTDALGEPGSDGDTYIRMMQYNTSTIVTALTSE